MSFIIFELQAFRRLPVGIGVLHLSVAYFVAGYLPDLWRRLSSTQIRSIIVTPDRMHARK
jgi:hypothetical protein